ncbi:MAG: Indolepyruvate ferredoxin oxidoreductase, alpha and beta subunit, partial [Pseudonocardiales bacterium]|nr:Indolepyruvate ferredoxin oxidoreductase, alpha and beta subunit [Pseudonocardiales bacterium]
QAGALPMTAATIEAAIRLNGTAVESNVAAFLCGRAAVANPSVLRTADPVIGSGDDIDAIIATSIAELTSYQNAAYADTYSTFVQHIRLSEMAVTGENVLAAAVAKYLFKLMAYKDEYEVARLSVDPTVARSIRDQFGADARYSYQLHPPVLRYLGRKKKISLGRSARPVLVGLAAMRGVRGRWIDPFGHTEVRRTERQLVVEYKTAVNEVADRLTLANSPLAVQIAELPDLVRGYEGIKLANVGAYRAQLSSLMSELRSPALASMVPLH